MAKRITSGARVQLMVEVTNVGAWGPECTVEQVFKQATTAAIERLQKAIGKVEFNTMKIIGEPKVTSVIAEYE